MRIGVDTGGTFTDTVVMDNGEVRAVGKAPTDPHDPAASVVASLREAAAVAGEPLEAMLGRAAVLVHGTTLGLNGLLTRTGASVGLLTTEGFEATLPIAKLNKVHGLPPGRRTRAIEWEKPPLLVPRTRIAGVRERIDRDGRVVVALDEAQACAQIEHVLDAGADAIAVCLLWSVRNAAHERRLGELVAGLAPGVPVSLSSDLSPRVGEYERTMTTVVNAYVLAKVRGYMAELEARLRSLGFGGELLVLQSSGGAVPASAMRDRPVESLGSGPVGGLRAAQALGRRLGHPNVVATDVGGTSFDVGLVVGAEVEERERPMIERWALALPVVAVESIGTGGGSVARVDPRTGGLRVGPESAGADPGPACYGKGGTFATVTDAAAVLGYVAHLAGGRAIDVAAARAAIAARVAGPLALAVEEAADGVLRVAAAQMADLVRRATVQRGLDLADFALYAYGGAGPQSVARYAAELGCTAVVVPARASVFSAEGAAASELRARRSADLAPQAVGAVDLDAVRAALSELEGGARASLGATRRTRAQRRARLRFAGQAHTLSLDVAGDDTAASLDARFRAAYEGITGRGTDTARATIELVGLDVTLSELGGEDPAEKSPSDWADAKGAGGPPGSRRAWFDGRWHDTPVHAAATITAGRRLRGPVLIESDFTTVVVPPAVCAWVDAYGNLHLALEGAG